jgi:hypothetical protein
MNNTTEKKCTKCGEVKDLSMFYKRNNRLCGFASSCKQCNYIRKLKYNSLNKINIYITHKKWRSLNMNKIKLYNNRTVDRLPNSYLSNCGYPPELHEIAREQIKLKRLIKELS